MISPAIRQETLIFLLAAFHGIFLALVYDVLRGLRKAVPHSALAVSFEDFFYWIAAGFLTFLMAFSVSDGVLRGYAAAAIVLGALLYFETVSRSVQTFSTWLFSPFCFLAGNIVRFASEGRAAVKRLLFCRIRKKWSYFAFKIRGKAQKRIEIKKKRRYNKKSTKKRLKNREGAL